MPRVDLSSDPTELQRDGPFIRISIGYPTFEREEALALGLEIPNALSVKALIDTGASITVINPAVASTQKLRQTGFAEIAAAGSSGRYPEYIARIEFPGTDLRPFTGMRVVACELVRQQVSCVVGRDILHHWRLSYDGRTGAVIVEQ